MVDDVWDTAHLKPFLRGGAGCARLITTRQAQVAADAQRVGVDQMTAAEATSLLLARIGERPRDGAPLLRLAQRLGEWPLLLALVGAAMRQRIERGAALPARSTMLTRRWTGAASPLSTGRGRRTATRPSPRRWA